MNEKDIILEIPFCKKRTKHDSSQPFPRYTLGLGIAKFNYANYMFYMELLPILIGDAEIYLTQSEFTTEVDAKLIQPLKPQNLVTEKININIDAIYETRHKVILVNVIIGETSQSNLRGDYISYEYFRSEIPHKEICPIIIVYSPSNGSYNIYRLIFSKEEAFPKAEIIACLSHSLTDLSHITLDNILNRNTIKKKFNFFPLVAELDEVFKLLRFIELEQDDVNFLEQHQDDIDAYYETAIYLGLIEPLSHEITSDGIEVLYESMSDKSLIFLKIVVNSWLMNEIVTMSEISTNKLITSFEIKNLLTKYLKTPKDARFSRCYETIIAWLRWLAKITNCVIENEDGFSFI